jgi:hypothetical protein
MRYMDGDRDGETSLIHERHDWVIVNRPKRKRLFLGEVVGGKHSATVAGLYYAPRVGTTWHVYAVERETEGK